MADEKFEEGQKDKSEDVFGTGGDDGGEDFGALSSDESSLGNLPPLSDFESSDGGNFDSNLPPLSGIDSDSDKADAGSLGGLPPISDIPVETPVPESGGLDTPASPATPAFDTPTSQHADTPTDTSGFQDLTADSDFTPETPEVAPPGPESDIETPMFDSAFGADSSAFSGAADTSAPTQAMETPMFGANPQAPAAGIGDQGFDADAFGANMDQGTPAPDFSPDTIPPGATPATMAGMGDDDGGGRARGMLVGGVIGVAALLGGIVAGPYVANSLSFMPNPAKATIAEKDTEISTLTGRVRSLEAASSVGAPTNVTPEERDRLQAEATELQTQINGLNEQKSGIEAQLGQVQQQLAGATTDLEDTTEKFVEAKADYDQLIKDTSITQAQKQGLDAEVDRLQILTGRLEDANIRRIETIESLRSNIAALEIIVREGNPLVPEKYSRESRIQKITDFANRAEAAKWVNPSLLDEFNELYRQELTISQNREYFFATVPVQDRFGTRGTMPAECLMNGNWGTYYRTLDGEHIGVYSNLAAEGPASYMFRDSEDGTAQKQIENEIFSSRTQGYEAMLNVLVQKHLIYDDRGEMQKKYDSL